MSDALWPELWCRPIFFLFSFPYTVVDDGGDDDDDDSDVDGDALY